MDFFNPQDRTDKNLVALFDRTQAHVINSNTPSEHSNTSSTQKQSSEEHIYGEVTKDEVELIFKSYNIQEARLGHLKEPITCDKVTGKSYAKLLHSKAGFHHPGSTSLLAKELGINSVWTTSLLGGVSNYTPKSGEDIKSLRRRNKVVQIKNLAELFHHYLSKNEKGKAQLQLQQALKINSSDPNTLACEGMICAKNRQYLDGSKKLKQALQGQIVQQDVVRKQLCECLYEMGLNEFHKNNLKQAVPLFDEAAQYDPSHQGVALHKKLTVEKMSNNSVISAARGSTFMTPRK